MQHPVLLGSGFARDHTGFDALGSDVAVGRPVSKNISRLPRCLQSWPVWLCVVAIIWFVGQFPLPAVAQTPRKPNITSDRYIINQTFDGQAFFKDNNVWVYTPTFAETFGMPPENTDPTLKAIEAAAFRVEERSYQTCGLGGKAENCKEEYRCITDIYVDEGKHPLPWATDQQADLLPDYTSLRWLRTSSERSITPKTPRQVIPNKAISSFTLRPFADPKTRFEANYFQDGDNPGNRDRDYNLVMIYGYKRHAIAGLTIVSMSYRCNTRNSSKVDVTFRLESREEIKSPTLQRFHEFQLPGRFGTRIDEQLQSRSAREREYYKKGSVEIQVG